ncbi:MAG: DUF4388 domain-containing protein [Myxococcales bacterium]|nr:DUF4388 domain-containing protein [Myxococcales bacterium]
MSSPTADPPGARILLRLVKDGLISPQQRDQVLLAARRGVDMSCTDAIVDLRILPEVDLLKHLANVYRTNFVTTQKLAQARVDQRALQLVPLKVAERLAVCPILFDVPNQTLAIVTDSFEDDDVGKQVQMASGVREVKVYLARRAAVKTLIRKYYRGEQSAFLELQMRSDAGQNQGPPQGGIALGSSAGGGFGDAGSINISTSGSGAYGSSAMAPPGGGQGYYDPHGGYGSGSLDPGSLDPSYPSMPAMSGISGSGVAPLPTMGSEAQPAAARTPSIDPLGGRDRRRSFTIEAPEIVAALKGEVAALDQELKQEEAERHTNEAVPNALYLETLNVLVALLENSRGELRGHSAQVARLTKKLCERVGLSDAQMHGILAAAYLHDIGKASNYHLTAYNVAQYEGHRVRAVKTHMSPLRMFEAMNLPESTVKTLTHMYERFDGSGFPSRIGGKEIPLGARILALTETYVDLTSHDKNPARKALDPKEAFEFMARLKETVFDPNLLDLFQLSVLGDDLKAKLLSDRSRVLVVDPDPEETTVLELRLVERGFEVVIVRSPQDAIERATELKPDVVISEVALTPMDGFALVRELAKRGINAPFLFLTAKGDRETVTRGFELGAKDFVIKPASADVVAAKVQQVLNTAPTGEAKAAQQRGVTGTLQEMSLPDVIQILAHGRKSGTLEIRTGGRAGELLFGEGNVWDANWDDKSGAEAVYAMLALTEGDFTLDLSRHPDKRVIQESFESLLLEGMRRLDEASR